METVSLVVVGLVLGLLSHLLKRSKKEYTQPSEWRAAVRPAIKKRKNYADFGEGYDYEVVTGKIAVRVIGPGPDLTVGIVDVDDDDFEVTLQALITKAEERAGALNAVADYAL